MQSARKTKRLSLFAVCLVAVLFLGSIPNIGVRAAGYSGSGTMDDPYLVQTAEQLQGMRDNLSAHYRLANTIDLSGMKFKPVGRLDAPFTGSFVCELNADLTPKYVIKNLSVSVDKTSYGTENKNKWEAALFGATNGATLSGIYVLDAKISNKNLGDNQGAVIYNTYKPGMEEMNSAILIGQAVATTVSNCGTTGEIKTRANLCGGLIGLSEGSTIDSCYSTATVTSEGKWHIGGLIGAIRNSVVSNSFSTGNVKGGQSFIGSFIGSVFESTISDCYTTGNAAGGRESKNAFAVVRGGSYGIFTNCFALGKTDKEVERASATFTTDNCWVLSGKVHDTEGFTEGSLSKIKAAFKNLSNWDVSGKQPKLKNVGVVTDASKYKPGKVSETPSTEKEPAKETTDATTQTESTGTATAPESAGTTDTTQNSTVQNEEPKASPEEVKKMIEALPNPEEEGSITIEHKEAVKEAWKAYETLTTGEKDEFDATLFAKLGSVRDKISILIAGELVVGIESLPSIEELTSDHIETILALWDDYTFLDESITAEIEEEYIEKLKAAYEFAQNGAQSQGAFIEVDTGLTKMERIIVIVCACVIGMIIVFNIILGVYILRHMRKKRGKQKLQGDEAVETK